uniref:Uncharacterized protein n=1 Tax=Sphaerodactylus townsendi TaxID=933632 RepID=A0ACB8ECP9_9SAUR
MPALSIFNLVPKCCCKISFLTKRTRVPLGTFLIRANAEFRLQALSTSMEGCVLLDCANANPPPPLKNLIPVTCVFERVLSKERATCTEAQQSSSFQGQTLLLSLCFGGDSMSDSHSRRRETAHAPTVFQPIKTYS